jgi:hypothetical protein
MSFWEKMTVNMRVLKRQYFDTDTHTDTHTEREYQVLTYKRPEKRPHHRRTEVHINKILVSIKLASNWHQIGIKLASNWHQIGIKLASNWHQIGIKLASNWHQIGIKLASNWHQIILSL